ncbi:hypothetical protein [Geminocystis sp. GBBB08]|uniref:hypothetical protein n=1 Tax=Geminocystis sp. GBBB08 TaxID=2604140 RepID=UPI0027E2F2A3|nr:hypothetical protein [Geminocystis sp. GBBB08]
MTKAIINQINSIANKRQLLIKLLDKPDLGSLRLDVNQAIEEIDELIEDLNKTFKN